jgi:hypothetical protein
MMAKKGFIEITKLSSATGRGMGLHEMVAYSGTKDKPEEVLGYGRFRSGSGYKKLMKKLKGLIE